jgi:hypothetical protein
MKYLALTALAATLAFAAAPAFAAQPTGVFPSNPGNANANPDNMVATYSSRVTQNGQFISGNCGCTYDNTTYPGSRADIVQPLLGH